MGVCFKRFRWAAIATALAALPADWPFDCAEISNTQMKIFKTFQIAYFCGLKLNWWGVFVLKHYDGRQWQRPSSRLIECMMQSIIPREWPSATIFPIGSF